MELWWLYPIVGGFILSILLTDGVRYLALRQGIVDHPDGGRKKHARSIPLLGGIAIFFSFAIAVLAVLWGTDHFTSGAISARHIYGFLLGGYILIFGGIFDDRYDLPARQSMLFPIIATIVVIAFGLEVDKITHPTGGVIALADWVSEIFLFIWLMGMTYTTKLLDGIDGLVTGLGSIAVFMIALLALSAGFFQPDVALLALIAFGSFAGFFLWNTYPAHIFLGEGGSTLIGYMIAVLAVISGSKVATALLVLGIPALDVAFVMLDRVRNGKSIKHADRSHLHFKLYDRGLGQREVTLLYFVIALLFGATTLIFESWQKLIALGVLFLIMLFTFLWLPKKEKREQTKVA